MRIARRTRRSKATLLAITPVLASLLLGGCAGGGLTRAVELTDSAAEPSGFDAARRDPLNARSHYETAMNLMGRNARNGADITLAKSGFQTAARLGSDMWEPLAGLAAAHYRLGEYREALAALGEAGKRRGSLDDLTLPFALIAFRAHEPELARLALAGLPEMLTKGDQAAASWLTRALQSGNGWTPPATSTGSGAETDEKVEDSERDVLIEAFLIRDTRSAVMTRGLNLLDSLTLQFAGTLVNYSYTQDTRASEGQIAVTLPGITYSLNVANRDLTSVAVEASPIVTAREGKTSKFLEGGSVLIVPSGEYVEPIERDIGIQLEVTPDRIGADTVDLTVALELSNVTGQQISTVAQGASLLQTDKTRVETTVRVPYRKAVLMGSAGSMTRRQGADSSITAVPLPGLSTTSNAASRRDVLALVSVRRADEPVVPRLDAAALSASLFGQAPAAAGRYAGRPSDTPDPRLEMVLARECGAGVDYDIRKSIGLPAWCGRFADDGLDKD